MGNLQIMQNKEAKVILDFPDYASSNDALKDLAGQLWPNIAL